MGRAVRVAEMCWEHPTVEMILQEKGSPRDRGEN